MQKSANSHLFEGKLWGIVFYFLAIFSSYFVFKAFQKKQSLKFILLIFLIIFSFVFWGFRFQTLYCLNCAAGG